MVVTREEEKELWDRWFERRCPLASDELIRLYKPLVHYHTERISVGLPSSVFKEDLISHGLLGLYDALEKFDPSRDLQFNTYASIRVRGAIIDGLRKEDWLPRTMRDKIKEIESTTEKLQQRYGRTVRSAEVAQELGVSEGEVEKSMAAYAHANFLSIDEKTDDSERDETYAASIKDEQGETPEEYTSKVEQMNELATYIEKLTEQEQLVISLFYYDEMTLTEIGHILNLSTSRISQIHSKSIFRLQQMMKRNKELLR